MFVGSLNNPPARSCAGEDRYLTAIPDGIRLRYRDEGNGPAVLLIHGWTLDLDMWDPQVEALRDRFRLVRFDRRGFGLSGGVPSLRFDAQDALALSCSLGLRSFACVGMSQGARVALHLATQAPETLSALVLDGPPDLFATVDPDQSDVSPARDYRTLATWEGRETFREHWRRHPLMRLWRADPGSRALLDRMIDRYPGRDLGDPTADNLRFDAGGLRAIRAPTLVISGEHDMQSRLDGAAELAHALPEALRVVVREAGHLPNLDNPQVYNEVLSDFLERNTVC
jgi:pimeloyl-ACP methyl ester carboxylesterase